MVGNGMSTGNGTTTLRIRKALHAALAAEAEAEGISLNQLRLTKLAVQSRASVFRVAGRHLANAQVARRIALVREKLRHRMPMMFLRNGVTMVCLRFNMEAVVRFEYWSCWPCDDGMALI